jgi:dihydrofolate reductase
LFCPFYTPAGGINEQTFAGKEKDMRKLIVSQFITLDGVMEAPEQWNSQYMKDTEVVKDIVEGFSASDMLISGRTTYEFFAARWPLRTGEMAEWFNRVHKYVVSTTLEKSEWNNSSVIRSSDEIRKFRLQKGKDILVLGSYRLVQELIKENLVDEFKLYIYPLTLGKGKRLFEEETTGQKLELTTAHVFSSGVIRASYRFAGLLP